MAVANYLLWPMTRFLNDKFVPAEHRIVANHITTVSLSSCLCVCIKGLLISHVRNCFMQCLSMC